MNPFPWEDPHSYSPPLIGEACMVCGLTEASRCHLALPKPLPDPHGETYDHALDYDRLSGQARRVFDCISDGQWWTLADLARAVGAPEASVSARLRDLRKPAWGSWIVERERAGGGLFRYRLAVPVSA